MKTYATFPTTLWLLLPRRTAFRLAVLLVLASLGIAQAETLPLPNNLIALDSEQGQKLFFASEANKAYFPLGLQFVTQDNPAFCGPASIAMVLNALHVPRPPSKLTLGLGLYDQENIFDARTEAIKPRATVMQSGMTLDELGKILVAHDLKVAVHHAGDSSLDEFRRLAASELKGSDRFVIVNYLRSGIGQNAMGHISPLAAYDRDSDRFLILDVSRYKYPPVWVEAQVIFAAMNTADKDNGNLTRGYVIVGR
jgi:glutathione-S-conjugate glycine hydrolase